MRAVYSQDFKSCYNCEESRNHQTCSFVSLWLGVPKKKKIRKFRATTAVKSIARDVLGSPPPVRRQENKKRADKPKHKPTLSKLLSDI